MRSAAHNHLSHRNRRFGITLASLARLREQQEAQDALAEAFPASRIVNAAKALIELRKAGVIDAVYADEFRFKVRIGEAMRRVSIKEIEAMHAEFTGSEASKAA